MRKGCLFLMCAAMLAACSQEMPDVEDTSTPSHEETVAALRQAVRDIDRACVEGNTEFFRRVLTGDFHFTGPDGETLTKQQAVGGFESGAVRFTAFETDEVDVRVYGDMAVVLGLIRAEEVLAGGELVSWTRRITWLWVRADGQWKVAAWHASQLPDDEGGGQGGP